MPPHGRSEINPPGGERSPREREAEDNQRRAAMTAKGVWHVQPQDHAPHSRCLRKRIARLGNAASNTGKISASRSFAIFI
jgi:hypothetical protein